MSFEAPPNVISAVVAFCKALYRNCRDAGDSYDEISREVRDLHTVLRHLKYEAEDADSLINRDHSLWSRQLAPMIGNCELTLRELDAVLRKYNRLAGSANSSPTTPRAQWARLASNEMDSLGAIRVKLISHKGGLTQFLNTIQIDQSGQMEMELDNHSGQLDAILDKVDAIAARMGQGNKGLMANYDDDDKEVWKQFRRELIAEGFSGEILMQHRDVLRAYIREIDQKGLLDETLTQHTTIAQGGANPERWLESVQSNVTVNTLPPTFSSLNVASDDVGAKMIVQEDNMKFPHSIKRGGPMPESREILEPKQNLEIPSRDRRTSSNISRPRQPSPVPRLITTQPPAPEEKEVIPFNNNQYSLSPSDSDSDSSKQLGLVIQTTDLLAATRALSLNPGSPLSFRSQSSFGGIYENDATRSIAQRPQNVPAVEYGSSPIGLVPGAIPIPNSSNPRSSAQSFSSSPSQSRSECNFKLAPDSQGKEIPPDAQWTKINRRLISPEVLDQDRRRYEARPDFVAVLGVLSREEIDRYARRSHDLREARRRRNPQVQPQPSIAAQAIPQTQPQQQRSRTIPAPRRAHFGRETPSSTSSDTCSSDSESSDSSNGRRGGQGKRKNSKGYAGSNVGIPISGYPNPFGSPPSPVRSPGYTWDPEVGGTSTSTRTKEREGRSERDEKPRERAVRDRSRDRERNGDRSRDRERDRDRDRDREKGRDGNHRHRHHHHSSSSNNTSRNKNGASEKQQRSSRWKENLTAAGIGGAAVSLLNVLSEAAEGL